MSLLGILTSRAGIIAILVIFGLLAAGGFIASQRHEAATAAVNQVAVDAARNQERVRREADAAARAAERDDVGDRLRAGTFLLDPVPARE